MVIGDATSLTEAGYVGDDVESLLSELHQEAIGDMDAAQRGIVSIDEIDKLRAGGTGGKDMRLGVKHALLKMLEGTVATVPPGGGYKNPMQPGIPFDTTDVLFTCGGACRNLVQFHGADLLLTDAAVREIAKVALVRGMGPRGLRSVMEEVLEGVRFEAEAGVRYLITEETVRDTDREFRVLPHF